MYIFLNESTKHAQDREILIQKTENEWEYDMHMHRGPVHSCMVAVSCIGLLLSSTVHTDAANKWFRGLVN